MRFRSFAALAGAALLVSACSSGSGPAVLESEDQKASYGIGLQMGSQLKPAQGRLDLAAFLKGVEDAMTGASPALPQEEVASAMQTFSQEINEAEQARRTELAQKNTEEGAAYLEENGAREGVMTTESGLQIEVLREGDGPSPSPDSQVSIHYRGTLIDGTQFDSSYDRGQPAQFGLDGVIPGFSEALQLMSVGGQIKATIPSELAYGPGGSGATIGPNATLIFEIELLEILD